MKKYAVNAASGAGFDSRGFAEYVSRLSDDLYHYSMSAEGDTPETLKITTHADSLEGVNIDLKIVMDEGPDGDEYYFLPIITLPVLDSSELQFADSVEYYFKEYKENIGRFVRFMFNNPFIEGMYDTYFEELEYEE